MNFWKGSFACFLLLLHVVAAMGQSMAIPDTPAGKRLAEFLAIVETKDRQKVPDFVRGFSRSFLGDIPEERHIGVMNDLHSRTGGFDLVKVEESSPHSIRVIGRQKQNPDRYTSILVETEATPPHAIAMLGLRPATAPTAGAQPGASKPAPDSAAIKRQLDEYLTRMSGYGLSGTVLVARDGQILFHKGYGMADREKEIPNTTETAFDIGSISKQFTAAAVMKLEMMGKLNTYDPISKYLDNVPADKQAITIHQLLTMTSGVLSTGGPDGSDATKDREKRVRQILDAPLNFPPGSRFQYSNEGYNLAAAIVERVSGQTLQQFQYENLFRPAGMTSTGFQVPGFAVPKWETKTIARLTGKEDNGYPWAANNHPWFLKGPGGILSTPGDLYKWHLALMGEKILSAEAKKKMYTPARNDYAYGWDVIQSPRGTLIQHNGGTSFGAGNNLMRYIDKGVVIAFSMNNSGESFVDAVSDNLRNLVFGEPVDLPPAVAKLPEGTMGRYAGQYKLEQGGTFRIAVGGNGLTVSAETPEAFTTLMSRAPSDRYRDIEARTVKVAEAAAAGDFAVLHEAFGREMPFEVLKERQQKIWARRKDEFGEVKAVKLLGTLRRDDGDPGVVIRYEFERGVLFIEHIWGERRMAGMRGTDNPPGLEFLPVSEREFVTNRVWLGNGTRITFSVDGAGRPTALQLRSGAGQVAARRMD